MPEDILAIDPGNKESAYVWMNERLEPHESGIKKNEELLEIVGSCMSWCDTLAIEMVASYGMPVGESVFETVFWIGRFWEAAENAGKRVKVYRKDVKMNLCQNMRAKDSNITQALIDRFTPNETNKGKGTKKKPGWFHGFKADIWQAYACGVTYYDMREAGQ